MWGLGRAARTPESRQTWAHRAAAQGPSRNGAMWILWEIGAAPRKQPHIIPWRRAPRRRAATLLPCRHGLPAKDTERRAKQEQRAVRPARYRADSGRFASKTGRGKTPALLLLLRLRIPLRRRLRERERAEHGLRLVLHLLLHLHEHVLRLLDIARHHPLHHRGLHVHEL